MSVDHTHAIIATDASWPARIRRSAAELADLARQLDDLLGNDEKFDLLITSAHDGPMNDEPIATGRLVNSLVFRALRSLIDITAYNNPEQDYPDMESNFEFRCNNVVFGRTVDIVNKTEDKDLNGGSG